MFIVYFRYIIHHISNGGCDVGKLSAQQACGKGVVGRKGVVSTSELLV